MTRSLTRRALLGLAAALAVSLPAEAQQKKRRPAEPPPPVDPVVAVVGASSTSPFYEALRDGAQEAANELGGGVSVTFVAPVTEDSRAQMKLVNDLIKQKVSVIIIAPVSGTALGPTCRRAMARGIKVISVQTPLPVQARTLHIEPTDVPATAATLMELLREGMTKGGNVGVIAANPNSAEEKNLIHLMMKEWVKPAFDKIKLAETAFGNDDDANAYKTADAMLQSQENITGLIAVHPVALAAAARAARDLNLAGKVTIVGEGVPSQMRDGISSGAVTRFAATNPVDLGYAGARLGMALFRKEVTAKPDETVETGRLGGLTVGTGNVIVLGKPAIVDKDSIERFARMY